MLVRYEVWTRRKRNRQPPIITWDLSRALAGVDWRRRTIRVRTFYDRHIRSRIVQFLVGDGF